MGRAAYETPPDAKATGDLRGGRPYNRRCEEASRRRARRARPGGNPESGAGTRAGRSGRGLRQTRDTGGRDRHDRGRAPGRGSSPVAARSSHTPWLCCRSNLPGGTAWMSVHRRGASPTACCRRALGRVIALDVGYGQLHPRLRADRAGDGARADERRARCRRCPLHPSLIVCDVSFISVRTALPPSLGLARDGWEALVLVKPQFEAGRARGAEGASCATARCT